MTTKRRDDAPPPPNPVDWDEMFPGRFLKAAALKGKRRTYTIEAVTAELLESIDGKRTKGILHFVGQPLQLAMNKTNALCLRAMFGRKPQTWRGKRVTLFPTDFAGEPCIRVWGSPDIERDQQVEIVLPRRTPFTMTMHRVVLKGTAAAPVTAPEAPPAPPPAAPPPDDDVDEEDLPEGAVDDDADDWDDEDDGETPPDILNGDDADEDEEAAAAAAD